MRSSSPTIYSLLTPYNEYCVENNHEQSPKVWHEFLNFCGLEHISMSRIKITNKQKWMLAKIKYGF